MASTVGTINVISPLVNDGQVTTMPATTPGDIAQQLGINMVGVAIHVDSVEATASTPLRGKQYVSFQADKVASGGNIRK
tara:strand:+ start:9079 stop:9315 length:237 start_codon:yes stop_codon:yes gene_type:complete